MVSPRTEAPHLCVSFLPPLKTVASGTNVTFAMHKVKLEEAVLAVVEAGAGVLVEVAGEGVAVIQLHAPTLTCGLSNTAIASAARAEFTAVRTPAARRQANAGALRAARQQVYNSRRRTT